MRCRRTAGFVLLLCSCGMALHGHARAQGEASSIVVHVVDESQDAQAVFARIVELVTPLGVFVRANDVASGDDPGRLATITISRASAAQVQVEIAATDGRRISRSVPLPTQQLDELAREAIATVCASNVQALLDSRVAAVQPVPATTSAPPPAEVAAPQHTDAPVPAHELPEPVLPRMKPEPRPAATRAVVDERPPPADTAEHVGAASERALLFAAGYELFSWGSGRLLNGPRLHARYARVGSSPWRLAGGFEAAITLPSNASESVFDVKLTTWSLRVLAEPELALSEHLALSCAAGLGLQLITAQASAASAGGRVRDPSQRASLALVLRPALFVNFARAWTISLGAGLELHPMQIRYGLAHPDGFTSALASSHVRPHVDLEFGYRF